MLVAPSSSKWKVFVVSKFSMMELSKILRFWTRCETVVAVPMFALYGLGGNTNMDVRTSVERHAPPKSAILESIFTLRTSF